MVEEMAAKTKKEHEFINNCLRKIKTWATNHYRILTYLNKGCLRRILENNGIFLAMNANIEKFIRDFFSLSNEQSNLLATQI
jgi:hypothetical protein